MARLNIPGQLSSGPSGAVDKRLIRSAYPGALLSAATTYVMRAEFAFEPAVGQTKTAAVWLLPDFDFTVELALIRLASATNNSGSNKEMSVNLHARENGSGTVLLFCSGILSAGDFSGSTYPVSTAKSLFTGKSSNHFFADNPATPVRGNYIAGADFHGAVVFGTIFKGRELNIEGHSNGDAAATWGMAGEVILSGRMLN